MSNTHSDLKPLVITIHPDSRQALFVFSSTNLRRHGFMQLMGMLEDDTCYDDQYGREMMLDAARAVRDLIEFDTLKAVYEDGLLSFTFETVYDDSQQLAPDLDSFSQAWFIRNDATGDLIRFDPKW